MLEINIKVLGTIQVSYNRIRVKMKKIPNLINICEIKIIEEI